MYGVDTMRQKKILSKWEERRFINGRWVTRKVSVKKLKARRREARYKTALSMYEKVASA